MKFYHKIMRAGIVMFWILFVFVLFSNVWVIGSTRKQILEPTDLSLKSRTSLLLGTSYNTAEGEHNPFFDERISVANLLYKQELTDKIILSGSKTRYYNEPTAMRKALTEFSVPDTAMVDDDGGVRTLDSIVRCKRVFKKDKIYIITQRFHAYRALFISNYYNMDAVVVIEASMGSTNLTGVVLREFFARPLAVIDLYLIHREPQYAGAAIN